jgi:hypothetical protein
VDPECLAQPRQVVNGRSAPSGLQVCEGPDSPTEAFRELPLSQTGTSTLGPDVRGDDVTDARHAPNIDRIWPEVEARTTLTWCPIYTYGVIP